MGYSKDDIEERKHKVHLIYHDLAACCGYLLDAQSTLRDAAGMSRHAAKAESLEDFAHRLQPVIDSVKPILGDFRETFWQPMMVAQKKAREGKSNE